MTAIVVGALVVGVTLGLLGSGGSILTVPVLTYFLGHDGKAAIAESLAIVGLIALCAALPYARAQLIDWRSFVYFGVPGMVGTYVGAWLAEFISTPLQLVLFALVMLWAAYMMLRGGRTTAELPDEVQSSASAWKVGADGFTVGVLTGLVGVGGGFLIVPALVLLGGLPMRVAVGTSLAIIALKSGAGFFKYLDVLARSDMAISWSTVLAFAGIGAVGSLVGRQLGAHVAQDRLRQVFAIFLILMGVFVLARELPQLWGQQATTAAVHSAPRCGDEVTLE